MKGGFLPGFLAAVLTANLLLLLVVVFQLDNREERQIQQSGELRALAESTDRLRAELRTLVRAVGEGRLAARPAGAEDGSPPGREWLHPEVPNLLDPHDFEVTVAEAEMDGTLTRYWGPGPKGLNPMLVNAADVSEVYGYVGASLASRMIWTDPDRYFGIDAERVEITEDNTEFTIYLKRGVLWHPVGNLDLDDPRYAWLRGPHELTAHDVAFTLALLKDPQVENGPIKSYYEDLESWEVIDDHTIVIRWAEPYYGAIEATLGVPILPEFLYAFDEDGTRFPEETFGTQFNQHWYNNQGMVGTGPYRFVSYEPGVRAVLERWEEYPGELPAIRRIIWEIFTDDNLQLLKLRSHEHDVGGLRPSHYREEILRFADVPPEEQPKTNPFLNGDIQCTEYTGMNYFYIGWNADRPIFGNPLVRKAMTHALDRQGIIDSIMVGLGTIPPGPFFALSPYNDPEIEPRPYDLERARELLTEAGWIDTDGDGIRDKDLTPDDESDRRVPFEFTLLIYANSPEMASVANIFKEDLLKIGVRMKIDAAEWSLMQKRMDDRAFDAFTGGWALSWDPDPYQIWHSSQADVPRGSNMVGFRDAEADEIIETLRRTFDPEERIRLLHRFHGILHEEEPTTLLYVRKTVACWWDNVNRVIFAKMRPHAFSLPWWVASGG